MTTITLTPAQSSMTPSSTEETLFDFFQGYIGAIDGTSEVISENCGQRFAHGMEES